MIPEDINYTLEKAKLVVHYQRLINGVIEMRHLQKEYFKHRNSILLKQAKDKEKEVDKMLEEHIPTKIDKQRSLF